MSASRHVLNTLLCLIFFTAAVYAGSTGKISGIVKDAQTEEGLPGVNVVVQGTTLGASTNIEGRYVILNIPPGNYTVVASLVGYKKYTINDLPISVDFTTPLNIMLDEGSVELDAVVVQAERTPLIRQDLTNPVANISQEKIEGLPVTEISQVIGLQGGIVVDDDGSLHIRGGLGNEVAYNINGMNINNPFRNTRAVGISVNAVEEVSVSSGTFNAEYGSALSGVVNYVTRQGGPRWSGNVRYFTGDYLSSDTDLWFNMGGYDITNNYRVEAALGGPILSDNVTFFGSGVYNWDGGWLYGERLYMPEDSYLSREGFLPEDPRRSSSADPYYFGPLIRDTTDLVGGTTGDSSIVPLNPSRSYNIQANLAWRVMPQLRIKGEFIADNFERKGGSTFSHRYMPDGRATRNSESYFTSLDITHSVNERMFYTLKGSHYVDIFKHRMFEDPADPRYIPSFQRRTIPNTSYLVGGNDPEREYQKTRTWAFKGDIVAQVGDIHEIKGGFDLRLNKVEYEFYELQFRDPNDPTAEPSFTNAFRGNVFQPVIPTAEGGYIAYTYDPIQMGAYIQDKIELFTSIILNLGFRYDYFDPKSQYNPNISQELSSQDSIFINEGLQDAEAKHMPQPRLSISFPITDQGTIRFSYGHFYQTGSLASLYRNPNYRAAFGTVPSFGNANVEPQRSIQYELGLQQGLTEDLRLEVTGFYKDVKDYIFSQQIITARGDLRYYVLTNLSYANTRGVIISFLRRRPMGGIFSASLDYTFQVAEGNRTLPVEEVFFNEQQNRVNQTFLVPQGFDRSHTLTSTIALTKPSDWNVSFIAWFRTGTPYTPQFPANIVPITFEQNSDRQPFQWNVDLRMEKGFPIGEVDFSIFLQVDNLFDVQNELDVWANSGRALYNIEETTNPSQFADLRSRITRGDPGMIPIGAVDNYYARPANIGRPRLLRFGATLAF
jgi:outer membrane receptor protein involved in Fe transport